MDPAQLHPALPVTLAVARPAVVIAEALILSVPPVDIRVDLIPRADGVRPEATPVEARHRWVGRTPGQDLLTPALISHLVLPVEALIRETIQHDPT